MSSLNARPEQDRRSATHDADDSGDSIKKVTTASMVGTVIEWFDFNLFGAMAALVLGPLFFPSDNPVTSTLLSLATFGVAFVARPIGGVVFGHFGDRYGRKKTLVTALLMMGIGTFAIGLLPTYASIGIAAPILLVVLRIMQGVALGGEYAGAALMVVEHKDAAARRGFFGSWVGSASPIGYILAAGLIAIVSAFMTEDAFNSWGWRVPFLLSAIMVGVGLYIRLQLEESSAFKELTKEETDEKPVKLPIVELLRRYPKQILASIGAGLGIHGGYYLSIIFGLSYARTEVGFSTTGSLVLVLIASVCYFAAILISGHVSDKIGRRAPMMFGVAGFGVWGFVLFPLLDTGRAIPAGIGFSVGLIFLGCLYGPISAWLSELFGTAVRYTGVSFGFTLAAVIGGGIIPSAAVWLLDEYGSTVPISIVVAAISVIAFVTLAVTKLAVHHKDADMSSAG
ncbi:MULTISPECIES: MFS transporter [unclassified Aeromicrobium]|uniref:MFS transporter n=1 Tax=unclassified Aeromicrobium TaxID=2633570 RepID=UPI00288A7955|nr:MULTISPECIES: MFS transporter [unclassified Aeromicrobium]